MQRISEHWAAHGKKNADAKSSRLQLAVLRSQLAEDLYLLKKLHCEPGPRGRWSKFLNANGIARSSAERYVRQHAKATGGETHSCTSGTSTLPAEEVAMFVKKLGVKLKALLTTPELLDQFLQELETLTTTILTSFGSPTG